MCGKRTCTLKSGYCAACHTKIRRHRTRIAAVIYLGGKCVRCGWAGHEAGFDFHHRDKKTREFRISSVANRKWEVVRNELDKCALLCALCHRLEHRDQDPKLDEIVQQYSGNLLPLPVYTRKTNSTVNNIPHGNRVGYTYYKCRCEACTAAQRLYMQEYKKQLEIENLANKVQPKLKIEPAHGTITRYKSSKYNCRCTACKAASSAAYKSKKGTDKK